LAKRSLKYDQVKDLEMTRSAWIKEVALNPMISDLIREKQKRRWKHRLK
jgi:hypothetical protein